jgi:flagellar M-ring protein FliF
VNETISRYWTKGKQYWSNLSRTYKIMFVSVVAFTIAAIALVVYNFSRTEYALAYTDLSPADVAAIKNYLEGRGIPYEIGSDGTSIGVPAKMVADIKVDVAAQNLIQDGSQGFGLFRDNLSSWGMTDNEFNVLSVDARAGEIQKLIQSIDGVAKARVLLTIPEESVFINSDEPEQSLASVTVTFKPGVRPTQQMIDSIYNLVKTGVPNLPFENITVIDQNGVFLSSSDANGAGGVSSTLLEQQLQVKKMVEADIQKTLLSFLGRLYGPDKVAVSVVATLNFDQKNAHVKTYTPVNEAEQTGIVRSRTTSESTFESEGAVEGGVAGTGDTDIPTYPGIAGATGPTSSEQFSETVNYEINEVTETIVSSPYVVQDLAIFAGIEPPNPDDPSSLSQNTVEEIKRMIGSIVSTSLANSGQTLTPEQVDERVSVIAQSFHSGAAAEPASTPSWYYGLLGAAAAALLAGGGFALYRRRKMREAALREEEMQSLQAAEYPELDIDQMNNEHQVRKQLEGLARRKPDEFVNLLRTWLAEE